jgi:flagellar basal body-associated protein FliL
MNARAQTGGSANDQANDRATLRKSSSGLRWIALLVLLFLLAVGGSYALTRGRTGSATQATPAPTSAAIVTPPAVSSAPTAIPVATTPTSSSASGQPTLTADQAQAAYLWQQSHEQDFCSCNTTNPPSSP